MADPRESRPIDEREFTLQLISLYRDRPELWKIKSKDYSNKDKKSVAMRKIVNVLKTYKPDFDEEKLKKKINVLRTNFNKEYQKVERKKRFAASSEDVPEPTLWYYNEFIFIKDQVDMAESEASEQAVAEESRKSYHSQSQIASPMKKKKIRKIPDSTQKLTDLAIAYFKRPANEADILAKGWAIKLSRVAPDQRRYAEKIINDTLFEAEMGTLTRNGVVFVTPPATSISPTPHSSPASYSSASSYVKPESYYITPEPNLINQAIIKSETNLETDYPIEIYIPETQSSSSATASSHHFQDKDGACTKRHHAGKKNHQ